VIVPPGKFVGIVSEERETMAQCFFTGRHILATNGKAAAIVPVEPDGRGVDIPGYVSPQVLDEARKRSRKVTRHWEPWIRLGECITFPDGATAPRTPADGRFPKFSKIVRKPLRRARRSEPTVKLDVGLLYNLVQAIQANPGEPLTVALWVDPHGGPVFVRGVGKQEGKAYGLLMPLI